MLNNSLYCSYIYSLSNLLKFPIRRHGTLIYEVDLVKYHNLSIIQPHLSLETKFFFSPVLFIYPLVS